MPRDINGNYTLPAGNPVAPNTVIESNWANTTMQDIEAALTNSLSRTGDGGMLAPFRFADGNSLVPSISWTNQPTAGWYRAGVSDFRYVINAVDIVQLTAAKVHLWPTSGGANVIVGQPHTAIAPRQAIQINNGGFDVPSADNLLSDGDKFIFWNGAGIKFGMGLESGGLWYQASGPGVVQGFKWYGGLGPPALQAQLEVNGNFVLGGIVPPASGGFVGFRASGSTGGFIDFFTGAVRRSVVYADPIYELRIEGVGPLGIALGAIGTPAVVVDTALATTQPIGFKGGHAGASAIENLPHGAGNPAPVDGDVWTTSAGLFVRINGVTIGPLGGVPAGTVIDFAGTVAPAGYLECDGAVIAEAAQPALFAAIGHTWDTGGEGAGNFRLPAMARRNKVGRGGAATAALGNAVGNTGGAETLTIAQMPAHTHPQDPTTQLFNNVGAGQSDFQSAAALGGTTGSTGGGAAFREPSAVFMMCIKV